MNIADILRKFADLVDQAQSNQPDAKIQNPGTLTPAVDDLAQAFDKSDDTTATGNQKEPDDIFLPPLQQKQELLKKAVGVENIYDDGTESDPASQSDTTEQDADDQRGDLLDRIKKLSGIPTAAVQELSNDDIFDD